MGALQARGIFACETALPTETRRRPCRFARAIRRALVGETVRALHAAYCDLCRAFRTLARLKTPLHALSVGVILSGARAADFERETAHLVAVPTALTDRAVS